MNNKMLTNCENKTMADLENGIEIMVRMLIDFNNTLDLDQYFSQCEGFFNGLLFSGFIDQYQYHDLFDEIVETYHIALNNITTHDSSRQKFTKDLEFLFSKLRTAKSDKFKIRTRGVIQGLALAMLRLDYINQKQADRITQFTITSLEMNYDTLNSLSTKHRFEE